MKLSRVEVKNIFAKKSDPELFWLLTGRAGSGKSWVLSQFKSPRVHPLHCGRLTEDNICTQTIFEALLAEELAKNPVRYLVEDKGRKVAHLFIPETLLVAWRESPHFMVEASLEERVQNIFRKHNLHTINPLRPQLDYLLNLKPRLGSALYGKLNSLCEEAYEHADEEMHREWIRLLVVEHLDPVFDYYFHLKDPPLEAVGSKEEIARILREKAAALPTSGSNAEKAEDLGS